MRVLFTSCPLSGHCLPMLPLARRTVDAGHEVAFLTGAEMASVVTESELEILAVGPDFMAIAAETMQRFPDAPLETGDDQQRFGFGHLFSDVRVELTIGDAVDAARAFAPALIVNEVADFVGPLVAAVLGIPNVTLGQALVPRQEWIAAAAEGVARHWTNLGLEPRSDAGLFTHLYLDQWPAAAQYPHITEVGAVQPLRPTTFGEDTPLPSELDHLGRSRPLVYVTLGTQFNDTDAFARILAAVDPLDVDVIATVGRDVDPALFGSVRAGIEVRPFIPQGALLPRCTAAVCHGGAGTLLGVLSHGMPMVIAPSGADQEENAIQIASTGAGELLGAATRDAEHFRDAIRALLTSPTHVPAAAMLQGQLLAKPDAAECVAIIEKSLVR